MCIQRIQKFNHYVWRAVVTRIQKLSLPAHCSAPHRVISTLDNDNAKLKSMREKLCALCWTTNFPAMNSLCTSGCFQASSTKSFIWTGNHIQFNVAFPNCSDKFEIHKLQIIHHLPKCKHEGVIFSCLLPFLMTTRAELSKMATVSFFTYRKLSRLDGRSSLDLSGYLCLMSNNLLDLRLVLLL